MSSPSKIPPDLALLLTLGWSLAVWLTGGVLAGRWAGTAWSLEPWGTLSGALAGLAGAGYTMYRTVRRLDRADPPARRGGGAPPEPPGSKTKAKPSDRNLP